MSGFDVEKLRSVLNSVGGFATTEKYSVEFTGLIGMSPNVNSRLTYLCENLAIPTKSISGADKFIYGTNYQMPYRQTFAESSMSFYCTSKMEEKKFFDEWQAKIIDPVTGDMKFHENYTCTITIKQYKRNQETTTDGVYHIELYKAWPSIVAEIQYGHSQGNEIAKIPVTFQYEKWLPKHATVTGAALATTIT